MERLLRVTFLGTAGSSPTVDRSLSAVAIRRKGELILLDCGEGTQQRMTQAKIGFRPNMKILISHLHGDHVLGIPGILQTMSLFNRKTPLKIVGPKGIFAFIECVKETVKFGLTFPLVVREIDEGTVCRGEEYTLYAVWVEHSVPCLAYALVEKNRPGRFYPNKASKLGIPKGPLWSKLQQGFEVKLTDGRIIEAKEVLGSSRRGRKVVYAVDTRPCDAVEQFAEGADLLIYEATFEDKLVEKANENYHSTPSQGAEIAKRAKVSRLMLTHIGGRCNRVDDFLGKARNIFGRVQVAEDLMVVQVPYPD